MQLSVELASALEVEVSILIHPAGWMQRYISSLERMFTALI